MYNKDPVQSLAVELFHCSMGNQKVNRILMQRLAIFQHCSFFPIYMEQINTSTDTIIIIISEGCIGFIMICPLTIFLPLVGWLVVLGLAAL